MSERDELLERAKRFLLAHWCATTSAEALADFAEQERNRAWNEACEQIAHHHVPSSRADVIRSLKRPSPPAQQDDKTSPGVPTVGDAPCDPRSTVEAAAGSTPAPGAPFDIERRVMQEIPRDFICRCGVAIPVEHLRARAIALAREAQQATAEAIAKEIEARGAVVKQGDYSYDTALRVALWCAGIARSHASPPQPAPETREERYRKAPEMILKEPALGISQARFAAREALGGGA